eukprot:scaffold45913_cov37-Phaeocystis_antarctica.AAC.1
MMVIACHGCSPGGYRGGGWGRRGPAADGRGGGGGGGGGGGRGGGAARVQLAARLAAYRLLPRVRQPHARRSGAAACTRLAARRHGGEGRGGAAGGLHRRAAMATLAVGRLAASAPPRARMGPDSRAAALGAAFGAAFGAGRGGGGGGGGGWGGGGGGGGGGGERCQPAHRPDAAGPGRGAHPRQPLRCGRPARPVHGLHRAAGVCGAGATRHDPGELWSQGGRTRHARRA